MRLQVHFAREENFSSCALVFLPAARVVAVFNTQKRGILMDNSYERRRFMGSLLNKAMEEYQDTGEYKRAEERIRNIEAQISKDCPEDKKPLVYKLMFEMDLEADFRAQFFYKQGMKACVFMLRELGMLR